MKIISKIDCFKRQYPHNVEYPILKKYSYKIVEESIYPCKIFNDDKSFGKIDCKGIACDNCFLHKGSVKDIKKYINLL